MTERGWWPVVVIGVACLATLAVGVTAALTGAAGIRAGASADDGSGTASSAAEAAKPRVAKLNRVVTPDLLVLAPRPVSTRAAATIERRRDVTEAVRVAAGQVRVGSRQVSLLGVDPSTFRAWTPLASARSDALWRALAYDQLVLTFGAKRAAGAELGERYPVTGERMVSLRLGGLAELLPRVDGVVTTATARGLGLTEHAAMLVNAPAARMARLKKVVRDAVGATATLVPLRAAETEAQPTGEPGDQRNGDSGTAETYRELYRQAATRCPGLSWTVLAAIGQVESGHGRNMGPSSAGARGPMQFMPATWRAYGVDGNDDGERDIWNPYDAVPAAADYLCASGAGRGGERSLYRAVYAYNHSNAYVRKVLATAELYASSG